MSKRASGGPLAIRRLPTDANADCPRHATNNAATASSVAASTSEALRVPPVASLKNPNMDGPTRPPRLPSEFTSAIPAAAAVPRKSRLTKLQKATV